MKKHTEKKLNLSGQTVAVLSDTKLTNVAGGRPPVTNSCAAECGSRRCSID